MDLENDSDITETGAWLDALTLGESIGMTAEVFEGDCTDLPPQKKK